MAHRAGFETTATGTSSARSVPTPSCGSAAPAYRPARSTFFDLDAAGRYTIVADDRVAIRRG